MDKKLDKEMQNKLFYFVLLLIVLSGGFLRFFNLNWDENHMFHPDERNIAMAVARIKFFKQMNPQFFAYGSFPIYLYAGAGEVLNHFSKEKNWNSAWEKINLIGRSISAFFSTITILVIFFLTKKIFNEKVAILASFFVAFSASLIQHAHYGTVESLLVFFCLILYLISFEIAQNPSLLNYFLLGLVFGVSVATKISALSFLIVPATVHLFYFPLSKKGYFKFLFFLLISFLVFFLFSPYTFLDWKDFKNSMNYEYNVASGKWEVVYTLQFKKTIPYLFQIKNFFWQTGPAVAFFGLSGAIFLFFTSLFKLEKDKLIFLSFPLAYFLYVGRWHTKFVRYMVPILPFLCVLAAYFLIKFKEKFKKLGLLLILLAFLLTLFWSLAVFSVYKREQTRISASKWIYANIPRGSIIYNEHWDDGLPVSLANIGIPEFYDRRELTIYEPDNEEKLNYYAEKLSEGDYIIISSRRLWGTLIHLEEKYPLTSKYYKLLFSGRLGYKKIAEFSSYPRLFGIEINDDASEETFQVFDHPVVMIFKNVEKKPKEEIEKILINK